MFIGIYLSEKGKTDGEIAQVCYRFAEQFTQQYGSLRCFDLRPNGFTKNDPPHACEELTCGAILYIYNFLQGLR